MSTYFDKPQSLIERKKAQWAREREELSVLSAPWCFTKDTAEDSRTRNVTKLASTTTNADLFLRRDSSASRRQSLPPIYRNQNQTYIPNGRSDKEMGGETSGYGSDNPNNTPEYFQQTTWNQTNLGYESSSSARDDRAKWGDRGVGVGKFWDPQDIKHSSKVDDTPGWVKRGLSGETELVVSNTSPAESPEQDRPYTSSSISQTRTYIRGQNNPIDPVELAERERKRQAALAHQEAIKQQLEEREQRRREERERKLREEYEEELRIQREQEMERKRREQEQQLLREKLEREKRRKQALQEAIQLAEKEAQEQKIKHKLMKQVNINISENVKEKEKVISPRPIVVNNNYEKDSKNNLLKSEEDEAKSKPCLDKQNNLNNATNSQFNTVSEKKENNVNRNPIEQIIPTVLLQQEQQQPIESESLPSPPTSTASTTTHPLRTNLQENIAVMLQPQYESYPSMPFAILMPTFTPGPTTPLPFAVPVQINNNNQVEHTPISRTENRILTPTQYRNRRYCDSSTQTDLLTPSPKAELDQSKEIKYIREKIMNMEVSPEGRSRKDSRSRTSERLRDNPGERPKWGANRPPTRYLKQSEKDPFYHRKKTRQKTRHIKIYDDKNNNYSAHSSDDSRVASPRTYRRKGYIEKRRTRALWQKNVQVYQTEIVPLEADRNHIYYRKPDCIKCCCDCRSDKHKYSEEVKVVDILKIEHTPREDVQYKETDGCLPECNNSSIDSEVLEKLNSLHTGLMLKQEQWQNSPCTPSLCSPSRTEIHG